MSCLEKKKRSISVGESGYGGTRAYEDAGNKEEEAGSSRRKVLSTVHRQSEENSACENANN